MKIPTISIQRILLFLISLNLMLPLIILLGIVSFFADIAYEGARSVTGPFFALLGASGAVVATFAGLAEFAGYGIRIFAGLIADKTSSYWLLTFIGYLCNLIVIPLFAWAGSWEVAALLLVIERTGKAIRTPSRDALLSYAAQKVGHGWGFGLHEGFDRLGGLIGPLFMFGVLSTGPHFKTAFSILALPAACALTTLYLAYKKFPRPEMHPPSSRSFSFKNFSKPFWSFVGGASLIGAGTLDFALVAYHLQKEALTLTSHIPLLYMGAIAISALFALVGGKWFDHSPRGALYFGICLGALSPLFLLMGNHLELWIGIAFWGIGMGTQTALFRSMLAHLIASEQRSTGYGLFGVFYGLAWFLGSALIGMLYDVSIAFSAFTSLGLQLLAFPLIQKTMSYQQIN